MEIVVRGTNGDAALAALLREKVHAVDPLIPVPGARSLGSIVDVLARRRALPDAAAFRVRGAGAPARFGRHRRRHEPGRASADGGDRGAHGARGGARRVVGGLLAEGMRLVALGLLIGIAGALAASRVLSSFLYGIGAADPATYAAVGLVLAACAALACWIPARRAAAIDPMRALRAE